MTVCEATSTTFADGATWWTCLCGAQGSRPDSRSASLAIVDHLAFMGLTVRAIGTTLTERSALYPEDPA